MVFRCEALYNTLRGSEWIPKHFGNGISVDVAEKRRRTPGVF
jgi:hypothetical protein